MKKLGIPALLLLANVLISQATELGINSKWQNDTLNIYISTQGKDTFDGTKARPVASFRRAQEISRNKAPNVPVNVIFAAGTYYLPETIKFDSTDNRPALCFMAEREGSVVISGGSKIRPKWTEISKGLYVAEVPAGTALDQLYVNGVRQRMARFPNAVAGKNVFDTWNLRHDMKKDSLNDPLQPERIASWKDPKGAYIHAMHQSLWGDMHWLVKGKYPNGSLIEEGGWQNNRPSPKHPAYRMVENVFEELDAPGEWFLDAEARRLYFMPETGTDLSRAKIEIVRLPHLFEFNGSMTRPVKNITLKGFVFRHTSRTFMQNREPLLRSDWTTYRGGAIIFNGAEDCRILDAEFDQVGGNAVFVNNYNRNILIRGCYIHDAGANGVAFVGDPESVRSPLFRYGAQNFASIDRTPGPKTRNFPQNCLVEDCLITRTGRVEKQTSPVQISMAHRITVRDCSIYDVPRAGINISEGTFGGHLIEGCDVFNTVLETGDHGSFNSWGRDRYWTPDIKQTVPEVKADPGLPFLDMLDSNTIRQNRWRCDHGWDIDLDDGSSWYRIYDNLLLNGGLKMREGYNRMATNNIIINNGLHPHVWYPNSGDVFTQNIVFTAHRPAIMDAAIDKKGKWGLEVDRNFFMSNENDRHKFSQNNCDSLSVVLDPAFIDAAGGDFRLTAEGLSKATGFRNFPMDRYGVKKPSLKKIAKQPEIPALKIRKDANVKLPAISATWYGITLSEPIGNDLSAYGVSLGEQGIGLENIPTGSRPEMWGFKKGDLLLAVNGQKLSKVTDFAKYLSDKGFEQTHRFLIIRNQQPMTIIVSETLEKIQ
ncbi:MAG: PDZ domain-containing protein [Chitinophagaceae bacterium]|jgi:hypothetical protein|nr:PDZ domain-containing protein [Chitinophagaceae bacterium]